MSMPKLIVALDVPSLEEAIRRVDRLGDTVTYYKVGSPLFARSGPETIDRLRERNKKVFLDLKFHDIPNTVAQAVSAAADRGVDMLTIHAAGGSAMMHAARDAAGPDGPTLLGVTLLTSFSAEDVETVWGKELRSLREEVARLAALAYEAELDGVVASALEANELKRRHSSEFTIVTPGIRPAGHHAGDQARTATPAEAARAGSDYLVVGRPILEAEDPVAVANTILADIRSADEESP